MCPFVAENKEGVTDDVIVRNDEVVGSIPTSFIIIYKAHD